MADKYINLRNSHVLHETQDGMWMYRSKNSTDRWTPFMHDSHFLNTRDHGGKDWEIGFFRFQCYLPNIY